MDRWVSGLYPRFAKALSRKAPQVRILHDPPISPDFSIRKPTRKENQPIMNEPFQALVLPAPTGTDPNYRMSCLVDSATRLPIMIPEIPGADAIREAATKSAAGFLKAFGTE